MPVKVIDKATQEEVQVDAATAQDGFLSGRFVLPAGSVKVTKAGRVGTVDAADALTALGQGARLVDDDEARTLRIQREESDYASQAVGGLEAALSGATLGLSRVAEEGLGVDPERMRARNEALAGAALPIELAAGLATTIGTGGAGAAGLAGRAGATAGRAGLAADLALAGRGVSRLGGVVERGIARGLGGGAGARVAAVTGRGVVEGVAAGAGAAVDEAYLLDQDLTAEAVAGSGLLGGLMGGGLGGGIGLGGAALGGATKASRAGLAKVLGRASGVDEASGAAVRAFEQAGQATPGGQWLDSYASMMGIDPETMRKGYGLTKTQRGRELIFRDLNDVRAETAGAGKLALDDHNAAFAGTLENITGRKKLAKLEKLLDGADETAIREQSASVLATVRQHIDDALAKPDVATSYVANDLRAAQGWHERAIREIATSADDPKIATFRAMERFKQDVDNLVKKRMKAAKGIVSPQLDDTIKLLRRVTSGGEDEFTGEVIPGVRGFLESEAWGAAGELQRTQNAALSGGMKAVENLRAKSPKLAKMFEIGAEVDESAVLDFVRSYTKAGGKTKANLVEEVLAARERALKVAKDNYDVDADDLAKIAKAEKSITDLRAKLTDLSETADASEVMSAIRRAAGGGSPSLTALSTLGPSVGGVIGSALGPLGAAAGFALGRITDPFSTLRSIAALQTTAEKFGASFDGISKRLRTKAPKAEKAAKPGKSRRVPIAPAVRAGASDRDARRKQAAASAAMYATNPERLAEDLSKAQLPTGIGGKVTEIATRAATYLAGVAPPTYHPPLGGPPMTDRISAERFARCVEGALYPMETLSRWDDGTLTQEHVHALRHVYPKHYESLRTNVLEALGEAQISGEPVSRKVRIASGVLLDLPTDVALKPGVLAAIQAQYAAGPQPKAAAPSAADVSQMDPQSRMTGTQVTESGMRLA